MIDNTLTMQIPFVDLRAQYLSIKKDIDDAISEVIAATDFIGGKAIKEFERDFSSFIGLAHCVACANGTDSLEILLKSMGIREGDEVIVPAISWISTSEAVSAVGATPVFVDIDEYFTIDASLITEKITPRTKAIIPVHLYGHPADMEAIIRIATKYELKVIEDCAQSHGATVNGKMTGTWGHAASFSFYPGKNLGAYGDAGAILTNDPGLAETSRMIANHGQKIKHHHVIEGRNSRLDTMQAAILKAKLPYLTDWTDSRIRNAEIYNEQLSDSGMILPKVKDGFKHVFHLYVVCVEDREALQKSLEQNGIHTAIHYPTALPFLPCYSKRNFTSSDFPRAHKLQTRILSLPMYAELTEEQIRYVSCQLKMFYKA